MAKKTKILVTGGCGFIGSNFVAMLLEKNCSVLNIDKLTYSGNLDNLRNISRNKDYFFINGDICDANLLSNAFNEYQPNYIVHFAAESHVDRSIDSPMPFIDANIVGTTKLLDVATSYWKNNKVKNFKFVHVSTDEVFGSLGSTGFFNESTPYDPRSPYSASKASSDHLVRAWYHTYGLPTIITNCSNNYGPYQFPEKLIPLMIANCIDEKPLPIYGKGNNVRDWLYVDDHCNAINKVLLQGSVGETFCIGGNNEIKNIDIVNIICNYLDKIKPRKSGDTYSDLICFVEDRPGHDFRYAIDSSKIQKNLKWTPSESFDTGIKKTIDWYLNNESWWRKIQYKQERLGLK